MGFGQGKTGGQTGAEVGAVDIGGAGTWSAILIAGSPEFCREPRVPEEDIMDGSGPVKGGFRLLVFFL